MRLIAVDLPCLRKRRSLGSYGPNYTCSQFIHYRKFFRIIESSILDSWWLFHVSEMTQHLSASASESNYLFPRTSTVGQLLYGRLSDIWSRKAILLIGLAVFFIGSLASSLAQTVLQLSVFRAFTGIGGGGLMTVAQLIVSDVVPLRERGKYQGILVCLSPEFPVV